jgi:extradiol dioxygenase family protein
LHAQQNDVTFFVIGKHVNYSQDESGRRAPVDYSFFSEIFLTTDGDAGNATLTFPTGEVVKYKDMRHAEGGDRDNILLVSGADRYTELTAMQQRYPDGEYRVSFATPSGSVESETLKFDNRGLPKPPQIGLRQNGLPVCSRVASGTDLVVSWGAFAQGKSDPNNILDDLVFVILTDATGTRVAHSGRPFEGGRYLTYADTHFTIDGSVLQEDQAYTLSVEHAILDDTTSFDGVPAFTTRAATTKLEFTSSSTRVEPCMTQQAMPSISSQITMLYYENIDDASVFYGEILGLKKTFDWTWVRFYQTGPASSVGIVTEGDSAWHDVQERNAVMVSLVTEEVDAWYERLSGRDDVVFLKHIGDGGGIRSFMLEDPGGYTIEFFQWLVTE